MLVYLWMFCNPFVPLYFVRNEIMAISISVVNGSYHDDNYYSMPRVAVFITFIIVYKNICTNSIRQAGKTLFVLNMCFHHLHRNVYYIHPIGFRVGRDNLIMHKFMWHVGDSNLTNFLHLFFLSSILAGHLYPEKGHLLQKGGNEHLSGFFKKNPTLKW